MRFPRLNASSTSSSKSKSSELVSKVKEFLVPHTVEGRKTRYTQYKDIGIFLGSIALIYLFEDKIRSFLEIDPEELRKFTQPM